MLIVLPPQHAKALLPHGRAQSRDPLARTRWEAAVICAIVGAKMVAPMTHTDTLWASPATAALEFRRHTTDASDGLHLPSWTDEDWTGLFQCTGGETVRAGEPLMRRGDAGRSLYFVVKGRLEVNLPSIDGLSLGRVAVIGAGSVLGEQAFFDGAPRSAGAWAIETSEVRALDLTHYAEFERRSPERARDLLFALGRVLAIRLRQTTARLAP